MAVISCCCSSRDGWISSIILMIITLILAGIQHACQSTLLCCLYAQSPDIFNTNPHLCVCAVVGAYKWVEEIELVTILESTLIIYSRSRSCLLSGGFHASGLLSPLAWLTLSVTANNCGFVKSFANCCLFAVVQVFAPDFQASDKGTIWSMSWLFKRTRVSGWAFI